MIKITNGQVFDERNQLAVAELMQKNLKGGIALKVVKVTRKLNTLLEDINKSVTLIRDKYTEKDADGNPVHPEDENGVVLTDRVKIKNGPEFNAEIVEIMKVENTIEDIEPISEKDIESVDISPNTILLLEWLIK